MSSLKTTCLYRLRHVASANALSRRGMSNVASQTDVNSDSNTAVPSATHSGVYAASTLSQGNNMELFEDAQGPPMFPQENQGVYLRAYFPNDPTAKSQDWDVIKSKVTPLPKHIPINSNDTLYTYTKRVHKASVKSLRSLFKAQLDIKSDIERQQAEKEVQQILQRKQELAAWKAARRDRAQKREALNRHKQAIQITQRHEAGMKTRQQLEEKHAETQRKILLALVEERRKNWILNPDTDIRSDLFTRTMAPTGWWPEYDPASNPHHAKAMAERSAARSLTSQSGAYELKDLLPQAAEEQALVEFEDATTDVVDYFARRALGKSEAVLPSVVLRDKIRAAIQANQASGQPIKLDEIASALAKAMADENADFDDSDAYDDLVMELTSDDMNVTSSQKPQAPSASVPTPGYENDVHLVTPPQVDAEVSVGGEGTLLMAAVAQDPNMSRNMFDDVAAVEARVKSLTLEQRAELQSRLPMPIDEIISRRKRAQHQFIEARNELTVLYAGMFDPALVEATRRELSSVQSQLLELRAVQHNDPEAYQAKLAAMPALTDHELELIQRYERAARRVLRKRDPFAVDVIDIEIAQKGYPRHELAETYLDARTAEAGGSERLPEQLAVQSKTAKARAIKPMPTHEQFIMSIVHTMPIAQALRDAGKEVTYENVINSSLSMQKHQEAWDHARVLNNAFYEKARQLRSKAEYYAARPDYNSIRMLELIVPEDMLPYSRAADAERLDLITHRGTSAVTSDAPVRVYAKGASFDNITEADRAEDEAAIKSITDAVTGNKLVDELVDQAAVLGKVAPVITAAALEPTDILNNSMPPAVHKARELLDLKQRINKEAQELAQARRRTTDVEAKSSKGTAPRKSRGRKAAANIEDDGEYSAGEEAVSVQPRAGARRSTAGRKDTEDFNMYSHPESVVSTGARQNDVVIDKDGNEVLSRRD